MPARASRQALGTHVGRVIFQSQASSKAISRKLSALPADKLEAAMKRRGLGDVSVKKLSDVLSGKDRVGMKQHDLARAVEALQDVGVAKQVRSGSQMVQTAAQEIQKGNGLRSLDPGQRLQRNINDIGAQRQLEEQAMRAQGRGEPVGILDKMRGVIGSMQRANKDGVGTTKAMEKLAANPEVHVAADDQGGIRGLRSSIRQALGMQQEHKATIDIVNKPKT